MDNMKIMQRAKIYIEKLANGINPLDATPLPESDIVNNLRISRCLFYVSDVLRQVIENGGIASKSKLPKSDFYISFEDIQRFPFSDTPIPISEIAKRINSLTENENMKKIQYRHIADWLISIEMLFVETNPDGKTAKRPTAAGVGLGITTETRNGMQGNYTVVLYNRAAQQFIIDNIDSVIEMMRK